jgi:hypothetical protein
MVDRHLAPFANIAAGSHTITTNTNLSYKLQLLMKATEDAARNKIYRPNVKLYRPTCSHHN